ncbi:hypothetical protein [Providencia alcalifaciens]|uniref:hypothetical protein n=1 Tax=Providencia alcalifaciens TaxID=126385 RepID=UPI0003E1DF34|nr:hypothetical protein [Providencia alcalifaciens]ETS99968.1 hypothetical protein HMPREF1568_0458 [Providencia alcalifaciens PAL-3]EUD01163.1 hypothetical protein HMPREF1566_3047 [Providencia alcalifaciens PAL-1]
MIEFILTVYAWIAGYIFSAIGAENDSRPVIIERLFYSVFWLVVGASMLSTLLATKILGPEK